MHLIYFTTRRSGQQLMRSFSTCRHVIDLRSDTVTSPSRPMLETVLTASTGDDVMGEDLTVIALEHYVADLFGKEKGLYVPTGTMANLVALLAHCHGRASEAIVGVNSHICLWEGGNAAGLGGIHTRQLQEDELGQLPLNGIRDAFRRDDDDHCAKTELVCLENTHNMMGGVILPKSYMDSVASLTHQLGIRLHVDGARIFNAAVALNVSVRDLCASVDSVSVCLSKGLGAPLGSVLVGPAHFIRLAKRARKRCGGGMRQAGVVAAMGLFAIQHNVDRLSEDHQRAKRLAFELNRHGFRLPRNGQVDTNIVYFGLPEGVDQKGFCERLSAHGVKITGGYSRGGELFRVVTHMDVKDEDIDRATETMIRLVT